MSDSNNCRETAIKVKITSLSQHAAISTFVGLWAIATLDI